MKKERKDLEKYINSIFIHTTKAVKAGLPDYVMFLVADVVGSADTQFLVAWPICKENDLFNHMGYPILFSEEELKIVEDSLFIEPHPYQLSYLNEFYPDSYYQQVSLNEAIESLKNKPKKRIYNLYDPCTRQTKEELLSELKQKYQIEFDSSRYKKDPRKVISTQNLSHFHMIKNQENIWEMCRIDLTGKSWLMLEIENKSEAIAFIREIAKMCNVKYVM